MGWTYKSTLLVYIRSLFFPPISVYNLCARILLSKWKKSICKRPLYVLGTARFYSLLIYIYILYVIYYIRVNICDTYAYMNTHDLENMLLYIRAHKTCEIKFKNKL